MNEMVNIQRIKEKAPSLEDPLKTLILSEPDNLTKEDYLGKSETWLKLLQIGEAEK